MLDFLHKGNIPRWIGRGRPGEEVGKGGWRGRRCGGGDSDSASVYVEEEIPPFGVVFKQWVCYACYVTGSSRQEKNRVERGRGTRSADYQLY
jgi:hypothetical protein